VRTERPGGGATVWRGIQLLPRAPSGGSNRARCRVSTSHERCLGGETWRTSTPWALAPYARGEQHAHGRADRRGFRPATLSVPIWFRRSRPRRSVAGGYRRQLSRIRPESCVVIRRAGPRSWGRAAPVPLANWVGRQLAGVLIAGDLLVGRSRAGRSLWGAHRVDKYNIGGSTARQLPAFRRRFCRFPPPSTMRALLPRLTLTTLPRHALRRTHRDGSGCYPPCGGSTFGSHPAPRKKKKKHVMSP